MFSKKSLTVAAVAFITFSSQFALAAPAGGRPQGMGGLPGSISGAGSRPQRVPLSDAAKACLESVFADLKVVRDAEHSCISAILTAQGIDPASLRGANRRDPSAAAPPALSADVQAQIQACHASAPSRDAVKAEIEACGK